VDMLSYGELIESSVNLSLKELSMSVF
jgi:hypothetical protein